MRKWKVTFQNDEVATVKAATYQAARSAARMLNYTGIHSIVLLTDARADRRRAINAYSPSQAEITRSEMQGDKIAMYRAEY